MMPLRRLNIPILLLPALFVIPLAGCSNADDAVPVNDPYAQALHDPMNYKPGDNISDGDNMNSFDPKAFKKDLDDFFNP